MGVRTSSKLDTWMPTRRMGPGAHALEQFARDGVDAGSEVCCGGQRLGACDGFEVRVPRFQRHGPAAQAFAAQAERDLLAELQQIHAQLVSVGDVFCKRALAAVRFLFAPRIDAPRVLAVGQVVDPRPARAEFLDHLRVRTRSQIAHGLDAHGRESLRGALTDAKDFGDRQGIDHRTHFTGLDDAEAIRLVQVRCEFCQELGRSDSDGRDECGLAQDVTLDRSTDLDRVSVQPLTTRNIEESLVQGERFEREACSSGTRP